MSTPAQKAAERLLNEVEVNGDSSQFCADIKLVAESCLAEQPEDLELRQESGLPRECHGRISPTHPPSAGEWTADMVRAIYNSAVVERDPWQDIADKINAAMREKDEQVKRIADFAAEVCNKAKDLQRQLNECQMQTTTKGNSENNR